MNYIYIRILLITLKKNKLLRKKLKFGKINPL
jgi:hypothetical protein